MTAESKMMIGLLDGIMPASTPLTVQTEIQVLELVGVVKDPELVKKMKLLTSIAAPGTPATFARPISAYRRSDAYELARRQRESRVDRRLAIDGQRHARRRTDLWNVHGHMTDVARV